MKIFNFFIICLLSLSAATLSAKDYKASLFGVRSDGVTLNTRSIQKGIDFISENGGGRLVFYVGRYLTGSVVLKSNVTIQLEEGAVIVGTSSVYDYTGLDGVKALICSVNQENIGITGKGVVEGSGNALSEQIALQIRKGYLKESPEKAAPFLIAMKNCKNIVVEGFNLMNSCGDVQSYDACKNLVFNNMIVKSADVKGSRGFVFAGCDGVQVNNSYFETSGMEISSAGTSKNVKFSNTKNNTGKRLQTTR